MKIGALLRLGGDVGELFADARALEAAGADSLWVLARDDQDPWILAAALAATTWRARLVVVGAVDRPETRTTLERISRGRLVIGGANAHGRSGPAAGGGRPHPRARRPAPPRPGRGERPAERAARRRTSA